MWWLYWWIVREEEEEEGSLQAVAVVGGMDVSRGGGIVNVRSVEGVGALDCGGEEGGEVFGGCRSENGDGLLECGGEEEVGVFGGCRSERDSQMCRGKGEKRNPKQFSFCQCSEEEVFSSWEYVR